VDFDPSAGTDSHTVSGDTDVFLTKFDTNGVYQWTHTVGGPDSSDYSETYSAAVDTNQNIYITGTFEQNSATGYDFDPLAGSDIHNNAATDGSDDAFILKLAGVYDIPTPTPSPTPSPSASSTPSSSSSPSSPTPASATPAPSPGSFPIINEASVTDHSVTIHFIPGADPYTHYILEYGRYPDRIEYGVNPIGDRNSTTFTADSLLPDTTYYFWVTAVNQTTPGERSPTFAARTLPTANSGTTTITLEPAPSASVEPVYDVTIEVQNLEQSPLPDMTVDLSNRDTTYSDVTDQQGIAEFGEVLGGAYDVSISDQNGTSAHQSLVVPDPEHTVVTYTLSEPAFNQAQVSPTPTAGLPINEVGTQTPHFPILSPELAESLSHASTSTVTVGVYAVTGYAVAASTMSFFAIVASLLPLYGAAGRGFLLLPLDALKAFVNWLLTGLGLWFYRKAQHGSIVFNTETYDPIAGAFVIFYSGSGNMKTAFSDKEGRYSVIPVPDNYKLRVMKTGFTFPSTVVSSLSFGPFAHVYTKDETFEIKDKNMRLDSVAIPLDPKNARTLSRLWHGVARIFWILMYPSALAAAILNPSFLTIAAAVSLVTFSGLRLMAYGLSSES
jgi:hypothetical protein